MEVNSTVIQPPTHSNVSNSWNLNDTLQTNLSQNTNTTLEESNGKETVRLMRVIASPVIIIFGTVGNLLILFIMRKEPLKKTPICFYMSVLAVTDTGRSMMLFSFMKLISTIFVGLVTLVTEILEFFAFNTKVTKYQGVKKFHILVRIGCYFKILVSVLLKLKTHIITHPSIKNDGDPSNI